MREAVSIDVSLAKAGRCNVCAGLDEGTAKLVSTTATFRAISTDLGRSLRATAAKPDVARETAYYKEHIAKVASVEDFIKDKRLFAYAAKAYGLESLAYAEAFMAKALREGVDSNTSFANTLSDRRYRDFVAAFDFKRYGPQATSKVSAQQSTIDRYVRQTLEADAGRQDEGVRLALYFERRAGSISSPFGILADAALLKVAQVALGLPAAMSRSNIDKQAGMITERLKITDLADPKKLRAFLSRFTAQWENTSGSANQASQIQLSGSSSTTISSDLAASLQSLRQKAR